MNLYYSPGYIGAAHAFDTTRKAGWVADSLVGAPIPGVTVVEPAPLTWDDVERIHDPEYCEAVRTGRPRVLAESQGFAWDPGLGPMVLASKGGAVAAARDALRDGEAGSLSSGLHHARADGGTGFCTFNGLVLAAYAALDQGVPSVLVLDLDAHCGGGTASLIDAEPRIGQLDVAVNGFDLYADRSRAAPSAGSPASRRKCWPRGSDSCSIGAVASALRWRSCSPGATSAPGSTGRNWWRSIA